MRIGRNGQGEDKVVRFRGPHEVEKILNFPKFLITAWRHRACRQVPSQRQPCLRGCKNFDGSVILGRLGSC